MRGSENSSSDRAGRAGSGPALSVGRRPFGWTGFAIDTRARVFATGMNCSTQSRYPSSVSYAEKSVTAFQAADLISATASIPSLNFTPLTTFGNWF